LPTKREKEGSRSKEKELDERVGWTKELGKSWTEKLDRIGQRVFLFFSSLFPE